MMIQEFPFSQIQDLRMNVMVVHGLLRSGVLGLVPMLMS